MHNVKLRITLNGCDSSRTIIVPGNVPLLILHEMIQVVFGWMDDHLHEFSKGDVFYQIPDEAADVPFGTTKDETKVNISHLISEKGDTFTYTYDFGDNWKHEIIAEDLNAAEEPYTCVEIHGINGVEDSMYFGGAKGIAELLVKKHTKQYKECVGWLKETFGLSPKDVLEIPSKEDLSDELKDIGNEYTKFGLERFLN